MSVYYWLIYHYQMFFNQSALQTLPGYLLGILSATTRAGTLCGGGGSLSMLSMLHSSLFIYIYVCIAVSV